MTRIIHLVRHGEVRNPDHVVYADLGGFGLSDTGREQARAAGSYLAQRDIGAIIHSPLQRAVETARAIGEPHGVPMEVDDRITEWKLGQIWAGIVWEDLPHRRPGELEAYLEHPTAVPFSPEPLSSLAARFCTAVGGSLERHHGELVFVAHQDPVQAARLAMTGGDLATLHQDKPQHGEVITLSTADPTSAALWQETGRWAPEQASVFPPVGDAAPESDRR